MGGLPVGSRGSGETGPSPNSCSQVFAGKQYWQWNKMTGGTNKYSLFLGNLLFVGIVDKFVFLILFSGSLSLVYRKIADFMLILYSEIIYHPPKGEFGEFFYNKNPIIFK